MGEKKKRQDDECYNLHSYQHDQIKEMTCMENVGQRGKGRMYTYFQSKNMEGKDHLEDIGIDGTHGNKVV